ncbi:MAG: 30S ribosome-binding factor RbfA [Actinomycetota bacterium]
MTSPRSYPRADRVRQQIKHVLAEEVERLRDPGLGFVTITDVTLTPDLRNAKAFYTVYGENVVHEATRDALHRATKHLRAVIAREVRLRYTPSLELIEDPVPDRVRKIDEMIAKLHREDE